MPKNELLKSFSNNNFDEETQIGYAYWCPGCKTKHFIFTQNLGGPVWTFNGNEEFPTFFPDVLHTWTHKNEKFVCHYFITEGDFSYCRDCTHHMAGQTVKMEKLPLETQL